MQALKAIANMKVDENTDHAQLSALCIAIARAELANGREAAILHQCVEFALANLDDFEEVTDESLGDELRELSVKLS